MGRRIAAATLAAVAAVTLSACQPDSAPAADEGTSASAAVYREHLAAVGVTDVTVSDDWAAVTAQPDLGAAVAQGAVPMGPAVAGQSVIYMKPVTPEVAASEAGRYVVLHEYAHVLQKRAGVAAVTEDVEVQADVIAAVLGADYTETSPAYAEPDDLAAGWNQAARLVNAD